MVFPLICCFIFYPVPQKASSVNPWHGVYGASVVILILVTDQIVIRPIFGAYRSMNQQIQDLQMEIKRSLKILSDKDHIEEEKKRYADYTVTRNRLEKRRARCSRLQCYQVQRDVR